MNASKGFLLSFVAAASLFAVACTDSDNASDAPYSKYAEVDSADLLQNCTKQNEGDSVYISSEGMFMTCHNGFWTEFIPSDADSSAGRLNIYAPADDTIPSLSGLPNCSYSYDSTLIFVASLNSYLLCYDYQWIEYKPKLVRYSSSSSESDSDEDWFSSSSYYSSSSKIVRYSSPYDSTLEKSLGPCTLEKEGMIGSYVDESYIYSVTSYICRSGMWIGATQKELDTYGWSDTTDGAFKEGLNATFVYTAKSKKCVTQEDSYEHRVYVFDRGWRQAKDDELCYGQACTNATSGSTVTWNGLRYACSDTSWKAVSAYDLDSLDFFNEGVNYGSLTDSRDGHVYRTVKIGELVWMAENLNYADSSKEVVLQDGGSWCFGYKSANCEIGGRLYLWSTAMGLGKGYDNKLADSNLVSGIEHRGLCPLGWHLPDTSEWKTLERAVDSPAELKAVGVWAFESDSVKVPTNSTGFTALPLYSPNVAESYCSSTQRSRDTFYDAYFRSNTNSIAYTNSDKDQGCKIRCVQNGGSGQEEPDPETQAQPESN